MTNEQREKIYQWVMASGLQDALFYKAEDTEGKEVVMDRFENFEAFAWNVEQEEREACAEVCKSHADVYVKLEGNPTAKSAWAACIDNRDAIRARGQA
jgi:hypothetical protein